MHRHSEVRRVVVVVLDGLRPDAVNAFDLSNLRRLAHMGASTMSARTVTPSLTWPALTSLLTGAAPAVHGILADSVHFPKPRAALAPLPELLRERDYPSSAFMGELPVMYRAVAGSIAKRLGFSEARFAGASAPEVLLAARSTLRTQDRGLVFFHWADADRAGHDHGWMSPQYAEAARRLDTTLGLLASALRIEDDPHTLLIALADHGGGGLVPDHHEGDHSLNWTIPMVLVGAGLTHRQLLDASLLDMPPTIAWALGVTTPSSYTGRVLREAFGAESASAVA